MRSYPTKWPHGVIVDVFYNIFSHFALLLFAEIETTIGSGTYQRTYWTEWPVSPSSLTPFCVIFDRPFHDFWTLGHLLRIHFGSLFEILGPESSREAPRRHPGAPSRDPGAPRRDPGGTQEAPRTHPGGTQEPTRGTRGPETILK